MSSLLASLLCCSTYPSASMTPVYHTKFHLPPSTYTILPALFSLLPCPALLLPPHMLLNICTLSLYLATHLAILLYLFPPVPPSTGSPYAQSFPYLPSAPCPPVPSSLVPTSSLLLAHPLKSSATISSANNIHHGTSCTTPF